MNFRTIPLRIKVALMLGGGMLLALVATLFTLFVVMQGDFDRMARALAEQRVQRAAHFLILRAQALRTSVADNAIWDETYRFATHPSADYLEKNYYNDPTLAEPYDFVLAYGADGRFLGGITHHATSFDPAPPAGLDPAVIARSPLLRAPDGRYALLHLGSQAAILASHDILPTSGEGSPAGTLVYGTFLSPALIEELRATTGVTLAATATPPPADPSAKTQPLPGNLGAFSVRMVGNWTDPAGPEAWLITTGLDQQPLYLRLRFEPAYFADIVRRPYLIVGTLAAGGFLLVAGALLLLEVNVLRAIASLDRQMAAVAQDPQNAGIQLEGSQEFARLAASANRMVEALREQQGALAAERRLLHSVFDAAAEGLLAFRAERDPQGTITDFVIERANPAGCHLLGITPETSIGWSLRASLARVGGDDILWQAFCRTANDGQPQHLVRPGPLSHSRWHDSQLAPWGDGVVMCLSDVTPQRESEQQLRASLNEIERFNRSMLGREERILELKREVNLILTATGQPSRYHSDP